MCHLTSTRRFWQVRDTFRSRLSAGLGSATRQTVTLGQYYAAMDTALIVPCLPAGEHYLLRPWELGDLPLVREASQDAYIPLITTVPPEYSPEAGEAFIRRQWDRAASGTGYPFIIIRRHDGRPIGNIGLWLKELSAGRASVGYWLAASARGRGAAAPALRAVADWALTDLQIPRIHLYVEPWNVASQRTAEYAGFEREGLLRSWQRVGEQRRDMIVYSKIKTR